MRTTLLYLPLLAIALTATAHAQTPAAIAVPSETVVATWHAEGAQVYECKAGADGKLAWAFREPIATLLLDGKTVGRHYAGPNWEHMDGSAVVAKAAGNAPAPDGKSIPWLKLEVTSSRGNGVLTGVTTVQRINTVGGKHDGACEKAGTFHSAPYAADYVFLKK
jgi:uncharacterized protein DUF3455